MSGRPEGERYPGARDGIRTLHRLRPPPGLVVTPGRTSAVWVGVAALAACGGARAPASAVPSLEAAPDAASTAPSYEVYVANESSDIVSRVSFEPGRGARLVRDTPVGLLPGEIDGAHGVTVAPDGSGVYVTLAHGTPYGSVWRLDIDGDTLTGRTELGLFPATLGVTPDGSLLFVVNFNLHGDMEPSDVSVVHTPTMQEVTRIRTCLMPHGSRVDGAGARHYSVCMHSDQLVEIDVGTLELSRRFSLLPGREGPLALSEGGEVRTPGGGAAAAGEHARHVSAGAAVDRGGGGEAMADAVCSPTWAEPGEGSGAGRHVYVACNRNAEILEVDVERWEVTRRFATGAGPYNLEATADGRWLLATLKGEQALAVIDLESGAEIARIPTTRPVTHGVVASHDARWAFVTNEAVGGTRGTLDVVDLGTRRRVASVELHHQPGGVDVRPPGDR
ncbi:MAG: YncE family protein [Gemmatimonadetes bacterium]|nr:YncE family protein [Gemmatimonadota bacterium]